jgi:hypothetical protein
VYEKSSADMDESTTEDRSFPVGRAVTVIAGELLRRSHCRSAHPDPSGGNGTTLVVVKKLGRRFVGFELSPDDAAAIRRRLDAAHPGQALSGSPEPTAGGKGRGTRAKSR